MNSFQGVGEKVEAENLGRRREKEAKRREKETERQRGRERRGGREKKTEGRQASTQERTLCRLRQCNSATNWWKLPSVTFSVSSKDNKGFCCGREQLHSHATQQCPALNS